MAVGAVSVLRERGISVPQQVAVVGFDDSPAAETGAIRLTTVHQPSMALGVRMAETMLAALRGEQPPEAAFTDPRELALLRWVEVVAVGPGQVPEAARREARVRLEDPELVELTLLVGATLLLNRFCTALELPTSPKVLGRLAAEGWR